MKEKVLKWFDIASNSMVYIIASYALTSIAMNFLSTSLLFFLFSVSELLLTMNYWKQMEEITKNKVIAVILLVCCFSIFVAMVYFIGYVSGTLIPQFGHTG